MPTPSLKNIETQIRKLQMRAQTIREKERKPVIASIVREMKEREISVQELAEALDKPARGARAARKQGDGQGAKGAIAAKYRNPESGATWSGRGRTPSWILDAEQSGGSRESFRI